MTTHRLPFNSLPGSPCVKCINLMKLKLPASARTPWLDCFQWIAACKPDTLSWHVHSGGKSFSLTSRVDCYRTHTRVVENFQWLYGSIKVEKPYSFYRTINLVTHSIETVKKFWVIKHEWTTLAHKESMILQLNKCLLFTLHYYLIQMRQKALLVELKTSTCLLFNYSVQMST